MYGFRFVGIAAVVALVVVVISVVAASVVPGRFTSRPHCRRPALPSVFCFFDV